MTFKGQDCWKILVLFNKVTVQGSQQLPLMKFQAFSRFSRFNLSQFPGYFFGVLQCFAEVMLNQCYAYYRFLKILH